MTLGEKIKKARKDAGMSQEQLAEKLLVSRSAIAKWETDKGLPDVQNLKSISSVLGITVDYLLDEDNPISMNTIREAINPADHSGTRNGCWQNSLVLSKFPEAATVYNLLKKKKLSKFEWIVDFITSPGVLHVIDHINDNSMYYLVESQEKQFLVNVTKEFYTSIQLTNKVNPKKFVIDNNVFRKLGSNLIK